MKLSRYSNQILPIIPTLCSWSTSLFQHNSLSKRAQLFLKLCWHIRLRPTYCWDRSA